MGLKDDETMIPVKKTIRERIKAQGQKGETYSDILDRVLKPLES